MNINIVVKPYPNRVWFKCVKMPFTLLGSILPFAYGCWSGGCACVVADHCKHRTCRPPPPPPPPLPTLESLSESEKPPIVIATALD